MIRLASPMWLGLAAVAILVRSEGGGHRGDGQGSVLLHGPISLQK